MWSFCRRKRKTTRDAQARPRRAGAPTTRRMGARTRRPGHAAAKQARRENTQPEKRKNHARRTGAPTTRRMGARTRSPGHAAAKQSRRRTTQETEDQKTRPLEVLLEPLGGLEINHCLNRFWRTPTWSPNGPPEAQKGDKIAKLVKPQKRGTHANSDQNAPRKRNNNTSRR